MKRLLALLFSAALPAVAIAAEKAHEKTEGQECAACHEAEEKAWLGGKHGLMVVKCVVCHGDPEVNFAPQPPLGRCLGCHGDQIQDVEKKLAPERRTCFLCHDNHTVAVKDSAPKEKAGFHQEGRGK